MSLVERVSSVASEGALAIYTSEKLVRKGTTELPPYGPAVPAVERSPLQMLALEHLESSCRCGCCFVHFSTRIVSCWSASSKGFCALYPISLFRMVLQADFKYQQKYIKSILQLCSTS